MTKNLFPSVMRFFAYAQNDNLSVTLSKTKGLLEILTLRMTLKVSFSDTKAFKYLIGDLVCNPSAGKLKQGCQGIVDTDSHRIKSLTR